MKKKLLVLSIISILSLGAYAEEGLGDSVVALSAPVNASLDVVKTSSTALSTSAKTGSGVINTGSGLVTKIVNLVTDTLNTSAKVIASGK